MLSPVTSEELNKDIDSVTLDYPDNISSRGILIADPETDDVIFTKIITDPELLETEILQPGTILKQLSSEILIAVTEYEAK